ncbi:hypothetical protein AHAS_Ahas06G0167600 [Arachis hypogaea]
MKFPHLYSVFSKYMIHGPYGKVRPISPCMKDGRCSKFYPKQFVNYTSFDEDGYPIYKRRDIGVRVKSHGVDLYNKFVVPYNPLLLMKYQAHINLEFCNKSNVIKYLFKYINKGPDRVTVTISHSTETTHSFEVVDEIKQYYDCRQSELHFPGITMTDEELQIFCLIEIEKLLQANGKSLRDFAGMPLPNVNLVSQFSNSMVLRELEYDISVMLEEHNSNFPKLNEEQKSIYDRIIHCVTKKEHGRIVINVASSGIASLLLPGGKTAHSMFGIPIELNEDTICRILKDSPKADLIQLAELIIWDEAPMTNKLAFKALDRSFRDIMTLISVSYKDLPFGGKIIVLGGDFQQVLLAIPKASHAEIVLASINSSILWKHFEVLTLTKDMRLESVTNQSNLKELKRFFDWILQIGEGRIGTIINEKLLVQIPNEFLIFPSDNPIDDIINAIYPDIVRNFDDTGFFQDRAILALKVEIVEEINDHILQLLPRTEKEYLSADSICGSDAYCEVDVD